MNAGKKKYMKEKQWNGATKVIFKPKLYLNNFVVYTFFSD